MSKKKKVLKEALKELDKCEKVIDDDNSSVKDMIKAMLKAIKISHKALSYKKHRNK